MTHAAKRREDDANHGIVFFCGETRFKALAPGRDFRGGGWFVVAQIRSCTGQRLPDRVGGFGAHLGRGIVEQPDDAGQH